MSVDESPPRAPELATERLKLRLLDLATRWAPRIVAIDGVLVIIVGLYSLLSSVFAFQGEAFLLVVAGIALVLFGSLMILGWGYSAVRTGMIGLTAGYFASALTEFQVATDPCDINSALANCAGHVPGGAPWIVYQGPLIIAVLLFIFIAFESLLKPKS